MENQIPIEIRLQNLQNWTTRLLRMPTSEELDRLEARIKVYEAARKSKIDRRMSCAVIDFPDRRQRDRREI